MLPDASPKHADTQNYKLAGLLGQLVRLVGRSCTILMTLCSLKFSLAVYSDARSFSFATQALFFETFVGHVLF